MLKSNRHLETMNQNNYGIDGLSGAGHMSDIYVYYDVLY